MNADDRKKYIHMLSMFLTYYLASVTILLDVTGPLCLTFLGSPNIFSFFYIGLAWSIVTLTLSLPLTHDEGDAIVFTEFRGKNLFMLYTSNIRKRKSLYLLSNFEKEQKEFWQRQGDWYLSFFWHIIVTTCISLRPHKKRTSYSKFTKTNEISKHFDSLKFQNDTYIQLLCVSFKKLQKF